MEFNTVLEAKNIVSDRKEIIKFLIKLLEYVSLKEKESTSEILTYAHRESDGYNLTSYEYISNMDQIGINAKTITSANILDNILDYLVTGNEWHIEMLFSTKEDFGDCFPMSISQIYVTLDKDFLDIQDIPLNKSNNKGRKNFPYEPFSDSFSIPNVCRYWNVEDILQKLI